MSEDLPKIDQADDDGAPWRRTNPLSIAVRGIAQIRGMIFPLIAIAIGGSQIMDDTSIVLPIFGVILAVAILAAGYSWYVTRYRIGSSDVKLETGLVARAARSVPFERIQDVSLEQKLLPRLFGLVAVRFETGAGGAEELHLAYVNEAEGEALRETIRARAQEAESAPSPGAEQPPAPREEEAATPIFAMDTARLFTFGLFEFSLVAFAIVIGLAQQFDFLLPFGWDEMEAWFQQPDARAQTLQQVQWLTGIGGLLSGLAGVIAVGVVTGVIRTALRDWDFRLERTAKGFRRRRGLLTRTDVVMPAHRVQALVISTGFLRRRFGWHGVSFISLAQDAGSANHDVAPFAKMAEIAPIVDAARFALPDPAMDWRRPSARYYGDRAIVFALFFGLPAMAAIMLVEQSWGLWLGLALALLAVYSVIEQFWLLKVDRHALDPQQVLSRFGWLAPRLQIASRVKLHSVEIAQGPLGRWRGYANLNFGLAGGGLSFRGLELSEAQKLREAVLTSIAAVDFARLPR